MKNSVKIELVLVLFLLWTGCQKETVPKQQVEPQRIMSISNVMKQLGYSLVNRERLDEIGRAMSIQPRRSPDMIDIGDGWYYRESSFPLFDFITELSVLRKEKVYSDILDEGGVFWIIEAASLNRFIRMFAVPDVPAGIKFNGKTIAYIETIAPEQIDNLKIVVSEINKTTSSEIVRNRAQKLLLLIDEFKRKQVNPDVQPD